MAYVAGAGYSISLSLTFWDYLFESGLLSFSGPSVWHDHIWVRTAIWVFVLLGLAVWDRSLQLLLWDELDISHCLLSICVVHHLFCIYKCIYSFFLSPLPLLFYLTVLISTHYFLPSLSILSRIQLGGGGWVSEQLRGSSCQRWHLPECFCLAVTEVALVWLEQGTAKIHRNRQWYVSLEGTALLQRVSVDIEKAVSQYSAQIVFVIRWS